jgi:hypothetical protein
MLEFGTKQDARFKSHVQKTKYLMISPVSVIERGAEMLIMELMV